MSERAIDVDVLVPTYPRRTINKTLFYGGGALAATGMLGVAGISLGFSIRDRFVDNRTAYEKSVPSDFLDGELIEWSGDDVSSLLGLTDRVGPRRLFLDENSSGESLLQGSGSLPLGKSAEITLPPVYRDIPTYDIVEVVANGQRRLATIIASPEPEETTVLFDPFETEVFDIDVTRRESGGDPVSASSLKNISLSYIENTECSESFIRSQSHGTLPYDDNSLVTSAPFDGYSVLYFSNGDPAVLHVNPMILEPKGTKPRDLYAGTKAENQALIGNLVHGRKGSPGRTTDVEWGTLVIIRKDGSIVKRIQGPHHATDDFKGDVIKTIRENNTYGKATEEEANQAQFKYKNKIMSPAEYARFRNLPNPYVLWLSLERLYLRGEIAEDDPIVQEVRYYYPRQLKDLQFMEAA